MANERNSLRFDHKEIAVIFSLFVFVSLLMFTVGILVGKGISQAKYESSRGGGEPADRIPSSPKTIEEKPSTVSEHAGSSLTTPEEGKAEASAKDTEDEKLALAKKEESNDKTEEKEPDSLKLIPQKPGGHEASGLVQHEHQKEAEAILSNPQLLPLIEDNTPRRKTASLGSIPESYSSGKFLVQIGSYPTEKEAGERVENLKKLGFPYAHFSAIEFGDTKEKWFRVWLGYYPDYKSANETGKILKDKGEVKHYLVRKSDSTG